MKRRGVFFHMKKKVVCLLLAIFACSCASTTVESNKEETTAEIDHRITYPPYEGPSSWLAVLPMGLSERAAKRYPHLLDKSVGLGVHNVLTDALFRTRRFRFVEDKDQILEKASQWQREGGARGIGNDRAISIGRKLGARKVIYGEVYDYAEGKKEDILGLRASIERSIRVGVQIRMVDVDTYEYIPASAVEYGEDWGTASRVAIERAVFMLVQSM